MQLYFSLSPKATFLMWAKLLAKQGGLIFFEGDNCGEKSELHTCPNILFTCRGTCDSFIVLGNSLQGVQSSHGPYDLHACGVGDHLVTSIPCQKGNCVCLLTVEQHSEKDWTNRPHGVEKQMAGKYLTHGGFSPIITISAIVFCMIQIFVLQHKIWKKPVPGDISVAFF